MDTQISVEIFESKIRKAEEDIDRQQKLIEELRRDGHPTHSAEILLQLFWDVLRTRERTLALLHQAQFCLGPGGAPDTIAH
jgi:hypothetical protein